MNYAPGHSQVEEVLKYIKEQLYSGRLQPGERVVISDVSSLKGNSYKVKD